MSQQKQPDPTELQTGKNEELLDDDLDLDDSDDDSDDDFDDDETDKGSARWN